MKKKDGGPKPAGQKTKRPSGRSPVRPEKPSKAYGRPAAPALPDGGPDRPEPGEDRYVKPFRPPADKPELLAPAGSKAAWAAAVEAGADAVYVGLNDFSARTYADNFSLAELKGVISESARLGVKIYLAMNSLVKEGELKAAWQLLSTAASLGPQALILQDLGLSRLAAQYFPEIARHASTLMAIHSLPGIMVLESLGFTRAVLARELALDEVAALSAHSPLGLEVFIHGALCFSFSGLCLMSSFLGGRSALRGGCTQPCRRVYARGGRRSALFSTSDLDAAPYIRDLKSLPLASLKIEGRMKGPDYVARVVSAYRLLLDAGDRNWESRLAKAEDILAQAPGRQASGGLLAAKIEGALSPLGATTSGLKLGFLKSEEEGLGRIKLERPLKLGDRLRLQLGAGEESPAFNLKGIRLDGQEVEEAEAGHCVTLSAPKMPLGRGLLFKISSGSEEKLYQNSPLVKAVKKIAENAKLPAPKNLPAALKGARKSPAEKGPEPKKMGLWLWLDKAEDLAALKDLDHRKVILSLNPANVRHIKNTRRRLKDIWEKIVWSLPPLIFYEAQKNARSEVSLLLSLGFRDFLISNLGHLNLIQRLAEDKSVLRIWADHRLGFLNHLSEKALADLGVYGSTLSLEADGETCQALWNQAPAAKRLLYLYGQPALFTSRFPLDKRKIPIFSPKGEKFRLVQEGGESVVIAERPVFMAPFLKMPPLSGGAGLIVDLRYTAHLEPFLRGLKKILNDGKSGPGGAFNFKRGLF